MNKHQNILLASLLSLAPQLSAEPVLTLDTQTALLGQRATLTLALSNGAETYAGINAKIRLPAGVSFDSLAPGELINQAGLSYDGHSGSDADGEWVTLIAYSTTGAISAAQGELFKINVNIAADASLHSKQDILFTDNPTTSVLYAHGLASPSAQSLSHSVSNGALWIQSETSDFDQDGDPDITDPDDDDDGISDSEEIRNGSNPLSPLENIPPVADFSYVLITGTLKAQLDASLSNDPDGSIVKYHWLTSDGQQSSLQKPTLEFSQAGNHGVALGVTDDYGTTTTVEKTLALPEIPKDCTGADFMLPKTGTAPLTLELSAIEPESLDSASAVYLWQLSDGREISGKTASMELPKAGQYSVTLTMTDDSGLTCSQQHNIKLLKRFNHIGVVAYLAPEANKPILARNFIGGFIIQGDEPLTVLMRASGIGLGSFGFASNLNPKITLARIGEGGLVQELDSNYQWANDINADKVAAWHDAQHLSLGLGLAMDGQDAALVRDLQPGFYVVSVEAEGSGEGLALLSLDSTDASRFVNLGAIGNVSNAGGRTMVSGFYVNGEGKQKVLIRTGGNSLAKFWPQHSLNPMLSLHHMRESGAFFPVDAENRNWQEDQNQAQVAAAPNHLALPLDAQDAALVREVEPGLHVVVILSEDGQEGRGYITIEDF